MRVLVDTSVWSLALRRRSEDLSPAEARLCGELARLVTEDRVVMIGPVRQELLSGLRANAAFERLRSRLRAFDDEALTGEDFEAAAQAHNRCRAAGISGSAVDFLICAFALKRQLAVFTTDRDFTRYASELPLVLHLREETGR